MSHRSRPLPLLPALLLIFLCLLPLAASDTRPTDSVPGIVLRRSAAEAAAVAPAGNTSNFVLAEQRTNRRDPLNGFKLYYGGWNISNYHYFASVVLTAAPFFLVALVWLAVFGLVLFTVACCFFCFPNRRPRNLSYSKTAYYISLLLLILFTFASVVGSIMLYNGQGKFHASTTAALEYTVGQADLTASNLRNLSSHLSDAKKIGVYRTFLPAGIQSEIDNAEQQLNTSEATLSHQTADNSRKIRDVLDIVRMVLIVVAAAALLLAFLGFLFSLLGMQCLVATLVTIGWIMVTATFILCGVFLVLHNAVADTCVAMDEWVGHPQEHTALDDILPCVDKATANATLFRSREVTFQLVGIVNQVISNVSNGNFPPIPSLLYFNQSGPAMPLLCNPYAPDLTTRPCSPGEVDFNNASQVWKGYECKTAVISGAEICVTVGRVTPAIYEQMVAAVSISEGLYKYTPFLVQLKDCTFVRDTFTAIHAGNCPNLERYSKWVYLGLLTVSVAVMLSLVFWLVYARERRHRMRGKRAAAAAPAVEYGTDKNSGQQAGN